MAWAKLSDSLSWSQGHRGKGYLLYNDTLRTWNVDPFQPISQHDAWERNREMSPIALSFDIDPDGGVITEEPTIKVESILQADPQLYDAGHRPVFEDDFNLDRYEPQEKKDGKPDFNFIMSSNWHFADGPYGYTNWDTSEVALTMDNDRALYDASRKLVERGGTPQQLRDWAVRKIIGPHNRAQIKDAQEWNAIPLEERKRIERERDISQFGEDAVNLGESLMQPFKDWENEGKDEDEIRREEEYDEPDLIDPELVNWQELHQGILDEFEENAEFDRSMQERERRQEEMGLDFRSEWDDPAEDRMLDAMYKLHGAKPESWFEQQGLKRWDDPRWPNNIDVNHPWEHVQQLSGFPDHFIDPATRVKLWAYHRQMAAQPYFDELKANPDYAGFSDDRLWEFAENQARHNNGPNADDHNPDMSDPATQEIIYGDPRIQKMQQEGYWQRLPEYTRDVMYAIQRGQQHPGIPRMQQALTQRGYTPEQIQQIMQPKWRWDPEAKTWIDLAGPPTQQWMDDQQRSQDERQYLDSPSDFYPPQEWGITSATNWEGLGPMAPLKVIPNRPPVPPRTDPEAVYQAIGEAMEQGDRELAQWLYQFLPERLRPRMGKTAELPHAHFTTGQPCYCSFGQLLQRRLTKTASKIQWLIDRADKFSQTYEGKRALGFLQMQVERNPKIDSLTPWLYREMKKGRIVVGGNTFYLQGGGGEARALQQITPPVLDHWADWFGSTSPTRRGVDVMQLDAYNVFDRVQQWDEEMKRKMEESRAKEGAGQIVHRFDDDWTVRRLQNAEEARDEGNAMGHCVGSYGSDIERGDSQIFSLRDPGNGPHATMEIRPPSSNVEPSEMVIPEHVWNEVPSHMGVPINHLALLHDMDLAHQRRQRDEPPAAPEELQALDDFRMTYGHVPIEGGDVIQTQGKSNAAPNSEYTERLDEWLHPHGLESYKPWWDDYYTQEGPESFEELLGHAGEQGSNVFGYSYPADRYYEYEPEDYHAAMIDADEHGVDPPELYYTPPNYEKILESLINPAPVRQWVPDPDNPGRAKNVSMAPWHGYNPEAGQWLYDYAAQKHPVVDQYDGRPVFRPGEEEGEGPEWQRYQEAHHLQELRDALQSHMDDMAVDPWPGSENDFMHIEDPFARERAMEDAQRAYYDDMGYADDPWIRMFNHLGPMLDPAFQAYGQSPSYSTAIHPEQQRLWNAEGGPWTENQTHLPVTANVLSPAVELREWLADLGGEDPAPSIHHQSEDDFVQAPAVSTADDLPYFPPANVPKEYKQASEADDAVNEFGKRLDQIPGVKRINEIPNLTIDHNVGDRVTAGYASPVHRSELGLPGEGMVCPNTGTVVNKRPPGTHWVYQGDQTDYGHGPGNGFPITHDVPSYDVQWDYKNDDDMFTRFSEPGRIGEALPQTRLWPEFHEAVYNALEDPKKPQQNVPDQLPDHWGALKYVPGQHPWKDDTGQVHQDWGRGLMTREGELHTWPTEGATHLEKANELGLGLRERGEDSPVTFQIDDTGKIRVRDPGFYYDRADPWIAQRILAADPSGKLNYDTSVHDESMRDWDPETGLWRGRNSSSESKTAGMTVNQYKRMMAELEAKMGPDKSRLHHQFSNGWSVFAPKSQRDVRRIGELMSHCWQSGFTGAGDPYVLRDVHGIPRVAWNVTAPHMAVDQPINYSELAPGQRVFADNGIHAPTGHNSSPPKPEHWDMIREWAAAQNPPVLMWHNTGQQDEYQRYRHTLGEPGPNPYWDPEAKLWRTTAIKTADSPITQADATNDPLGKPPAIEPSRQGDPDYLDPIPCPHCKQEHRADQPCPDSSVGQYKQMQREWANRDPNASHGAPEGLTDHQTDLGSTAGLR